MYKFEGYKRGPKSPLAFSGLFSDCAVWGVWLEIIDETGFFYDLFRFGFWRNAAASLLIITGGNRELYGDNSFSW